MEDFNKHFLYPSNLMVSTKPYIIDTVLGSCVAVCIYDPILKFGGMNHYMLPFWNGQGLASPKYGNIAIEKLIDKMLNHGSKKGNLIAKVFGGGEVIKVRISNFHIGERNIMVANEILANERIMIKASSVGGNLGRKIRFNNNTGEVLQRFVQPQKIEEHDKALFVRNKQ